MKRPLLLLFFFILSVSVRSQFRFAPPDTTDPTVPHWVRLMCRPDANVFEVEAAYTDYQKTHPEGKTYADGYYQHWRRYMQEFVNDDGSIDLLRRESVSHATGVAAAKRSAPWTFAGPDVNYRRRFVANDPSIPISWHANVYCIDRSLTNRDVLYCGTENGGVYKTSDQGNSWIYLSENYDHVTVTAIAVSPADENEVLMCSDERIYRTVDGGATWTRIQSGSLSNRNLQVFQFLYDPGNPSVVFAAAADSLYRSVDGGLNWQGVFKGQCQSVAFNPLNAAIVYALRYDAVAKIPYFHKSLDSGITFTPKPTGWFTVPAADAGLIESFGGRIAVTEADTSRVYVLLVGSSQASAQLQLNGQIGVYRSDDGGETWSLPHGLIGAPYNASTHPNMMTFDGGASTYNQIYYNTALIASQLNPNKLLIGGMSLWRSNDGASTFGPVGGYLGSVRYVHPDNQELKVYKTGTNSEEVWVASDGGINYSQTFMMSHVSRTAGIYGAAFWGFDQGWNDDIMVGGRYHNGNAAYYDGYPDGEFLQLGGGEAATGYVNYSNEKKTYFSDIDGVVLPDSIDGYASSFGMDTDPNESYVDNSSSRILFDWDYWNVAYVGKDNSILKSTTAGRTFFPLHAFGSNTGDKVYWIEQSRVNKNILFAQQVVNNRSVLWRSVDRGATWNQIVLPQSKRELLFTLSGTGADELWIAYPGGTNGNKVYKSINSGTTWTNITTAALDNLGIEAMAHQFGTHGGVYLATYHGPVFYRNASLPDWTTVGSGLPRSSYPLRTVPFYRDNKLRLATWQLGVWETELSEPSAVIADFSADYRNFYCPGDTVRFVPHAVASANAVYQWYFPGAVPAAFTGMYPEVVYQSSGTFDITLVVTDQGQTDTITKYGFIETVPSGSTVIQEDFQSGQFPADWRLKGISNGNTNWTIYNGVGGFGLSNRCMHYDNYNIDAGGARDEIWTAKCDLSAWSGAQLGFDVAYADYSPAYSDSLEILVSTDCGLTFTSVYQKGGQTLASAPTLTSGIFIPSATDWRRDSVDISAFTGNAEVIIAFVNIGHYGQALYVDNIGIDTIVSTNLTAPEPMVVGVYPNPFIEQLKFEVKNGGYCRFELTDALGRTLHKAIMDGDLSLETSAFPSGIYWYRITDASGTSRTGKLIKNR
ncbi:MAG: hypothetical protein RL021_1926 [Bacteroidota bacterium]